MQKSTATRNVSRKACLFSGCEESGKILSRVWYKGWFGCVLRGDVTKFAVFHAFCII